MVLFTNGKAITSGYRNHMFRMSGEEGVYAPAIRKGGGYMRVTHWMHLPAPPDKDNNVPVKAPDEPLTLEQLREMDGQPVWWDDGAGSCWGIISVDTNGRWAGIPFFRGRWKQANFEYDIESRGMVLYRRPPEGEA